MNKDYKVKGIGENVVTEGGTERQSDEGRGQPSLISPFLSIRLSKHLQRSAIKYEKGNWAKGQKFSRIIDGIERHLNCYKLGMRDEDHLSAMLFGLMSMVHFEETEREEELNDLSELWGLKNTKYDPMMGGMV